MLLQADDVHYDCGEKERKPWGINNTAVLIYQLTDIRHYCQLSTDVEMLYTNGCNLWIKLDLKDRIQNRKRNPVKLFSPKCSLPITCRKICCGANPKGRNMVFQKLNCVRNKIRKLSLPHGLQLCKIQYAYRSIYLFTWLHLWCRKLVINRLTVRTVLFA